MFKRFWSLLSTVGIQSHYDNKLIKRITLTNQFGAIATIVCVLSSINDFMLGSPFSAIMTLLFAFLCLIGFWFNKKHFHKFSTSFLIASISIAIFYFDSYLGVDAGSYLYHFPLIFSIAFLIDFKEKKIILFHFSLILIFLLTNILTNYSLFNNPEINDSERYSMFVFNLIFSITAIVFFMYLTIANNMRESAIFEYRINKRKATEQLVKQALSEKNVLLAEIHHRVKNNLAIITSLLNLQINSIENNEAKNILLDSKNRVKSMALIHDRLYKSDSLSDIDFAKYTRELINEIQYSYPTLSSAINVNTNVSDLKLSVNNAIPCGLILNELLTNCYKHAFKGRAKGIIDIVFKSTHDNILKLVVKDNGVGLKEDYEKTDSLGMVVIRSLSEQLDGTFKFTHDNGTCFELEFKQQESVKAD